MLFSSFPCFLFPCFLFLFYCLFFPCSFLTCERPILPQISLITQRNAASCIISQIKDSCLIVESCSSCLYNKAVREYPRSFLARSLHVNGRFSRRSRRLRRGNAASCIISQTKDSYHIVECCFMFIQQICKRTRLLLFAHSLPFPYFFLVLSLLVLCSFLMFPCSFLMCLTAVLAFLAEIKFRN